MCSRVDNVLETFIVGYVLIFLDEDIGQDLQKFQIAKNIFWFLLIVRIGYNFVLNLATVLDF